MKYFERRIFTTASLLIAFCASAATQAAARRPKTPAQMERRSADDERIKVATAAAKRVELELAAEHRANVPAWALRKLTQSLSGSASEVVALEACLQEISHPLEIRFGDHDDIGIEEQNKLELTRARTRATGAYLRLRANDAENPFPLSLAKFREWNLTFDARKAQSWYEIFTNAADLMTETRARGMDMSTRDALARSMSENLFKKFWAFATAPAVVGAIPSEEAPRPSRRESQDRTNDADPAANAPGADEPTTGQPQAG